MYPYREEIYELKQKLKRMHEAQGLAKYCRKTKHGFSQEQRKTEAARLWENPPPWWDWQLDVANRRNVISAHLDFVKFMQGKDPCHKSKEDTYTYDKVYAELKEKYVGKRRTLEAS